MASPNRLEVWPLNFEVCRGLNTTGQKKAKECQDRGLNTGPPELQSVALPAELSRQVDKGEQRAILT